MHGMNCAASLGITVRVLIAALATLTRADEALLTLSTGSVRGLVRPHSRVWLRVPYAEKPGRWRPPVPKAPWRGTLDGTVFGPACPQPAGFDPPITSTAEDCLSLAIYAPRAASVHNGSGSAVMVYIHGGSFLNGGASEARLNATRLVERSGGALAVVVLQYRLGVLGFLGAEALRERGGDNSTGNYGLQDQRLALQWVRAHAAAFGGDGRKVTIVGQSAGAASVSIHIVAPRSAGLFHRASMWSGAFPDWAVNTMDAQQRLFAQLARALCGRATGASAVKCLEALSAKVLVDAAAAAVAAACGGRACMQPTIDGVELVDEPRRLLESTDLSAVGLLMGSGRDEGDGFDCGGGLARDADVRGLQAWLEHEYCLPSANASHLASLYMPEAVPVPAAGASAEYVAGEWAETDQSMWCGARRAAHAHASFGGGTVNASAYLYRFYRGVGGAPFVHHSDDIPFWFDATEALAAAGALAADLRLARRMSAHLAAFVVRGDPAAEACSECDMAPEAWPAYTLAAPASLELNLTSAVRLDVQATQCAFWDAHPYFGQESVNVQ